MFGPPYEQIALERNMYKERAEAYAHLCSKLLENERQRVTELRQKIAELYGSVSLCTGESK